MIGESIEVEVHPDYTKAIDKTRSSANQINNDSLIHRFFGAVEIEGQTFRVKTTMRELKDDKFKPSAHSYEVTKIELLETPSANPINSTDEPLAMISSSSISIAKLLNGIEKSYDSGKKILEESRKEDERVARQADKGVDRKASLMTGLDLDEML